jgi:predicted ATPase
MIEKLWVKNYRSLKDVRVEFGKITVLVGLNGSGKSTLLDVLHFVSDALLLGLDSAIFKRQGISMLRRCSTNGQVHDVEIGLSIRSEEFNALYEFALGSPLSRSR